VLHKRRKLVIDNLERTKSAMAATRIQALPLSSTHVFGDQVQKIKESLKLTQLIKQKDKKSFRQTSSSYTRRDGDNGKDRAYRDYGNNRGSNPRYPRNRFQGNKGSHPIGGPKNN
jgi:hypothetical protein